LIAPKSKHTLKAQCTDAVLLAGDEPHGQEPDSQRFTGPFK
jgi:hypothetical protein